jgi:hypothetical protein
VSDSLSLPPSLRREAAIKASVAPETTPERHLLPQPRPDTYMGCKFLTSSQVPSSLSPPALPHRLQLFALELSDPAIRQQICTQLLILLHHRIK